MFAYQGHTALVTGASSGIGREFAKELAKRKMALVLVARSVETLNALAAELRASDGVRVEVVAADLSQARIASHVRSEVERLGLAVDLLVNCAGFVTHGYFEKIDPVRDHDEVMVNCTAMVDLCHAFVPAMLERRRGGVINVASVAGFQPIPFMAVYAASKAFVINFSIALWEECRHRGVRVVTLCPGTTDTPFFDVNQAPQAALGKRRTASQVVATALAGLDKKRSLVIDGAKNGLLSHGPRLIPRWLAAKFAGQAVRPKSEATR